MEDRKEQLRPKGMNLYDPSVSIKRKANRTGDEVADAGKNVAVHNWTTSGASVQGAHEAKEAKQRKANPAPVRTLADMTEEEKASIGKPKNLVKSDDGQKIKTCSCGTKLTTKNAKFIGEQELPPAYPGKMRLYNCPKCDSTVSHMTEK